MRQKKGRVLGLWKIKGPKGGVKVRSVLRQKIELGILLSSKTKSAVLNFLS